jgi:hypothetical protein
MKQEPQLVALTTAARMLGLSLTGVRLLADRGDIPSIRDSVGRRSFISIDVEHFRQQREEAKARNGKTKLKLRLRGE